MNNRCETGNHQIEKLPKLLHTSVSDWLWNQETESFLREL